MLRGCRGWESNQPASTPLGQHSCSQRELVSFVPGARFRLIFPNKGTQMLKREGCYPRKESSPGEEMGLQRHPLCLQELVKR